MQDLPSHIDIHEEGPREGFQFESRIFPLADRVALVDALSESGLRQIQVASFVNPKAVPQMADAGDLFQAIRKRPGVRHTALWLNERGFRRAQATPGVDLKASLLLHTSDTFSHRNNGCGAGEMRKEQERWIGMYVEAGLPVEAAYVMTAFGCNFQGDIPLSEVQAVIRWLVDRFEGTKQPLPVIMLADTVGWAVPTEIERRVGAVRDIAPTARIGLHLHDTRGAGMANFYAALRMGVDVFEGSVAGLGGCPFAGHGQAAGNICTEDIVFMAHEMGIETGIDLERLIEAARQAERLIGRTLPGRVLRSGSLAGYRT
ncbi:hydroxymethylglutaryl-CoA lyase [Microbaculum marinisediminis]|uniref:Hydroxymethylglutaryl-CoA lyase n=1 Tax=Microbaculum marinisediminis TaxID=2931392 RepID=A0AAW5R288_9HYPH|nr:hydroxymethylglutaryl-CoA lyase [Microbaculum sp. A6E488]MCT8974327.1 hydroxymethylglutaryl-CoA lyase [Microbaculum sp. A6E488]